MDLFDGLERSDEPLSPGAILLRGFAASVADELLLAVHRVVRQAPFRQMLTPGGWQMSVAMTNCGSLGWITDRTGCRYDAIDPETGHSWPAMSEAFDALARRAADAGGFSGFEPDACLINRWRPYSRIARYLGSGHAQSLTGFMVAA